MCNALQRHYQPRGSAERLPKFAAPISADMKFGREPKVCFGSNPERLNTSISLPLYARDRTSSAKNRDKLVECCGSGCAFVTDVVMALLVFLSLSVLVAHAF
jgi:hypothetical protein